MEDTDKTKAQLMSELVILRRRVADLEALTAGDKPSPSKLGEGQRAAQLEALRQIGLELTTQLELDSLFLSIITRATELLGGDTGGLYLYRPGQEVLELVVAIGVVKEVTGTVIKWGEGLSGRVWQSGQPVLVADYQSWEGRAVNFESLPFTTVLGVPIYWRQEFLGVLNVANRSTPFSTADTELLSLFAVQAAAAIYNAHLVRSLRESEEKYRSVVNNVREVIFQTDPAGRWSFLNRVWTEITGFNIDESLGQDFLDFVHPSDRQRCVAEFDPMIKGEKSYCRYEVRYLTKMGELRWLEVHARLILDTQGEMRGMSGTLRDVTRRRQAEETLRAERNLLRTVIDNIPDYIYIKDRDSRFKLANIATARYMGTSTVEELIDKTDFDFYPHELAAQFYADEQRVMASGQALISQEEMVLNQAGTQHWILTTKVPLGDGRGQIIGIVGVGRDITERLQAEEKRDAHQRFLTLLNDITYTALKTTNLQEMLQILADRLGELIGADGCFITLWDEASQRAIPAAAYGELRQRYRFASVKPNERTMTQSVLEAGHALVIEDVFSTPYMNPNVAAQFPTRSMLALPLIAHHQKLGAALIGFNVPHLFAGEEITYCEQAAQQVALAVAKARLLEALTESEARFRATFEQAAVGIAHLDLEGHWLRVNQKLCDIFGYSREELLTTRFQDITFSEDLETDLENTRKVLADEIQTYTMEKRYRHHSGSLIWAHLTVSLVRSSTAEPEYFIAVIEDITRRKQLEEQLQQLKRIEAVSTLAAGIAHDFNNILTVINGNCELILSENDLDNRFREDIKKIHKGGLRAANLTRQLLAFSRQQLLQPQVVSLNAIVAKAVQSLRQSLAENIGLTALLEAKPDAVNVDPNQFEQVIGHLVGNACDAMPQGGQLTLETSNIYLAEKEVSSSTGLQPGPYVALLVSDTGSGIEDVTQPRIFEPFFTTKEFGRGTGLGLAVVYGIVKQSGGYIQFQSNPSQGTSFKIFLPKAELK